MAKKILIVDDSTSLRQVVAMSLKGAGYSVVEAGNGSEGLAKLNGDKYDMVISDVNMPVMDGLTFVEKMKENATYKFVPVVMLTTEARDDLKQRGKAAGVKAWMVKPFVPEKMIQAVQKLTS